MKNSKAEPEVSNQSSVQSKHCEHNLSHINVVKWIKKWYQSVNKKKWFEC